MPLTIMTSPLRIRPTSVINARPRYKYNSRTYKSSSLFLGLDQEIQPEGRKPTDQRPRPEPLGNRESATTVLLAYFAQQQVSEANYAAGLAYAELCN
jgi:hypothetical protein